MAWFITACVITVFLIGLSQSKVEHKNNTVYNGTCASIGYSTKCCPPANPSGKACRADNGTCRCDAQCHSAYRNDCCADVFCIPKPRTCQDIGCCNNDSADISERCSAVFLYDENGILASPKHGQRCSTSTDCPQNCNEAKLDSGLCKWQFKAIRETCRVNNKNCYCDPYCVCFNDCCDDVQEENVADTYFTLVECMTMYARFEEKLKINIEQEHGDIKSKADYSIIQTENDEAYAQFILAFHARKQNMQGEASASYGFSMVKM